MGKTTDKPKKLWIVIFAAISLIIAFFQLFFSQAITSDFSTHMREQRMNSVNKMVHLAHNSVKPVIEKARAGEISVEEARETVSDFIRNMTYEDEFGPNYIFMSSYEGTMLVQPFEPEREGSNQWDLKDANGKYIIRELVKAAKEKPEGSYVTYDYYPPNKKIPEEKLSYVIGIPEINAYIGTGMYTESSYVELRKLLDNQRNGFLLLTVFILASLMVYVAALVKGNSRLAKEVSERIGAENDIRTIFNTIHDAILIHDENGKILQTNQRAGALYGLENEGILQYGIEGLSLEGGETVKKLQEIQELDSEGSLVFEWKFKRPLDSTLFDGEVALRKCEWSGKNVIVAAVRDISDRKAAEETLRESENRYRTLYQAANDAIMILDENRSIVECNGKAEQIFGCSREELTSTSFFQFSPEMQPDGELSVEKADRKVSWVLAGFPQKFEWQHVRLDGTVFFVEVSLNKVELDHKVYVMSIMRDITERKDFLERLQNQYDDLQDAQRELQSKHDELSSIYEELTATEEELRTQYEELQSSQRETQELAQRYMLVLEASNDVIWEWGGSTKLTYYSDRYKELLGYSKDEPGEDIDDIYKTVHPEDVEKLEKAFKEHIKCKTEYFSAEFRVKLKSGSYKWVMCRGKAIVSDRGEIVHNAGSITDITARKQYEEEIRQLAYYDYLTGLPNRVMIVNQLKSRLGVCSIDGCCGSVFFIDVDNFKIINDTFGHSYGDRVLIELANKLKLLGREDIIIGRIGGDEFIVVQDAYTDEQNIRELAEKILELFENPIIIEENNFNVTCSIGIALYPKDGSSEEEILKNADLAMYRAKNQGKNNYVLYDARMGADLAEKIELEKHLREAYKNKEFMLYYQPQIDAVNGSIVGLEALIRWNSPIFGFVSPARFIPIAEEIGLINDIGRWVISERFAFAKKIMDKGICVSCNISSMQLMQSGFVKEVMDAFESYGLKKGSVALEITESCLIESFEDTTEKLALLRDKGILIYLDDFGTGYSSLTYLKNLPIDTVKIDKSFIDDITFGGVEGRIVKSIISLAHQIGLKVVAEGVETKEQMEYLASFNCNYIQGYLVSRPVPEAETEKMI